MTNDTDREHDILARLNNAAEALRDTLAMFVDDDLDSADLVITHNIDYAIAALDAATSYLREQRLALYQPNASKPKGVRP